MKKNYLKCYFILIALGFKEKSYNLRWDFLDFVKGLVMTIAGTLGILLLPLTSFICVLVNWNSSDMNWEKINQFFKKDEEIG